MQWRGVWSLLATSLFLALCGWYVIDWWNGEQLLWKLRARGVQTTGVVTKVNFHFDPSGYRVYDLEYDYTVGGTVRHHLMQTHDIHLPVYETLPIAVTYLPDDPASSVPFSKSEVDTTDVTHVLWYQSGFAAAYFAAVIPLYIVLIVRRLAIESRLIRDGVAVPATVEWVKRSVVTRRRIRYRFDTPAGAVRREELWTAYARLPEPGTQITAICRREGDKWYAMLAANFKYRKPLHKARAGNVFSSC